MPMVTAMNKVLVLMVPLAPCLLVNAVAGNPQVLQRSKSMRSKAPAGFSPSRFPSA